MVADVVAVLAALLLVAGGLFCFASGLGILRFPDVFMRMHAATKAGTLGLIFLVAALALVSGELDVVVKAILVSVFMILTTPVGSHLIGRAAFRTGVPLWGRTSVDPECERFRGPRAEDGRAG